MEKNSIRWEILLKGARGTLSPEEEIIFQKWLARDIRHKAYYEKMCRVWSSDNTTYDLHTDVSEMIVRFDDYVRNKRKVRRRKILRNDKALFHDFRASLRTFSKFQCGNSCSRLFRAPSILTNEMPHFINTCSPA